MPVTTPAQLAQALRGQRDRFYAERMGSHMLGHILTHARDADLTLTLSCDVCGLTHEEPVEMPLTLSSLARCYCPGRLADEFTVRDFWYEPWEHRADVRSCFCDTCVPA